MGATVFLVRDARTDDLDEVERLAALLDSVNLPADRAALGTILGASEQAFDGTVPPAERTYVFALEDSATGSVHGVSMVIAAHGTPDDPHHYYQLDVDERFSRTLGRVFRHPTMRLKLEYTPHTEIGALILDPALRGHPDKLGRLLSFSRFLYMAAHRSAFCETVEAELLPPLEPDGSSRLWNWLGRRFTGLTYREADQLSRTDAEFIKALFPMEPIYVSLMPESVRSVIGAVGTPTLGVERMLVSVGFAFNDHIDPFDGGPHFAADIDEVTVVSESVRGIFAGVRAGEWTAGLIGAFDRAGRCAAVVRGGYVIEPLGRVFVDAASARTLGLAEGDAVVVSPGGTRSRS